MGSNPHGGTAPRDHRPRTSRAGRALRARVISAAALVGTALGLGILLTLPVWRAPTRLAAGTAWGDLPAHFWSLWWVRQPQTPPLANHPVGDVDLYVLEPLNLLLARALDPLLGAVLAHNVTVLLALFLAGLGGYALGKEVSGSRRGGWVALLLLETAPPTLAAMADGAGEFVWVGVVAAALAACIRLARAGGRGPLLLATAAIWLTAWSCWYHGLFLGLAALTWCATAHPRGLPRLMGAFALALLLLAPWIVDFQRSDLDQPVEYIVEDPWTRLPPAEPLPLLGERTADRVGWELAAWGLLAVGLLRGGRRRWAPLAVLVLGWVLACGSATPGGTPLPWALLNSLYALTGRALHMPFRLYLVMVLGMVALASLTRPRPWVLAGVGALLVVDVYVPRASLLRFPVMAVARPAPLVALADADGGAVLDLPSVLRDTETALNTEALHQWVHGHPIPRFPIFPTSAYRDEGLRAVRATAFVTRLAETGEVDCPSLPALREALDYRWLVLDTERGAHLGAPLDACLGRARWAGDGLRVYDLEHPPPGPPRSP